MMHTDSVCADQSSCSFSQADLAKQFCTIRNFTERLAGTLTAEDCMIQSMPDASPVRWHFAHTTWFFETFILKQIEGYQEYNEHFSYCFNSYYNAIGSQFPRPNRGTQSRPSFKEILDYRHTINEEILKRLDNGTLPTPLLDTLILGLHHEQQHQELILTDIKHAFASNPILPTYEQLPFAPCNSPSLEPWLTVDEGIFEVGFQSDGFCYDNELPSHSALLTDVSIASQVVTCGEYFEFINAGGYERPDYWLSLGWEQRKKEDWTAPLYWVNRDGVWYQYTLAGCVPIHPDWPVCHVSYFEADAYARWAGMRLPTEFEWEIACRNQQHERIDESEKPCDDSALQFADELFARGHAIHPTAANGNFLGCIWEWTSSAYHPYPGFRPQPGAIGEYNGKFMCNQYVLRGGSVATSHSHIRESYRNFFAPAARWQFSGIRLAQREND